MILDRYAYLVNAVKTVVYIANVYFSGPSDADFLGWIIVFFFNESPFFFLFLFFILNFCI